MFVAALLPDAVADDLDAFLEVRREAGALRWTSREQWHLTLAFLPDVADAQVELLLDALAGVAGRRRSLSARVGGGGAFPGAHAARVLWTGVSTDEEEELSRLAAGCRTAAATHGVATPREKFRPHLTLARSPHPFEATRWIRVLEGYRSPEWLVDRIALVASYLGEGAGGRPRYQVLAELELG
ncbi:MAG: RNA 2',3'-cyclic phosphodiesterase [Marmoricola sp.]